MWQLGSEAQDALRHSLPALKALARTAAADTAAEAKRFFDRVAAADGAEAHAMVG